MAGVLEVLDTKLLAMQIGSANRLWLDLHNSPQRSGCRALPSAEVGKKPASNARCSDLPIGDGILSELR